MPKGYIIFTETIHDPEAMKVYSEAAGKAIAGGPKPLAVRPGPRGPRGRVARHPDRAARVRVRGGRPGLVPPDAYQAAVPLRQAAADTDVAILAGF